jgi:tetratricopeptide (TPR) repeat protein
VDEIDADRYRMHDLLRVYAAERAAEEDTPAARQAAIQRLLSWYLHTADAACSILRPHRPRIKLDPPVTGSRPGDFASYEEALEWCERERVNLVPATRLAAAIGDHLTAWQLPAALIDYFYLRKPWHDWITTHEIGLDSARVLGDSPGEAGMLTGLGVAYYDIRRVDDAIDCLEQARPTWRRLGFTLQEAFTLYALGAAYQDTGRLTEALGHLEHSLSLWRKLGNHWGQGVVLRQLGDTYRNLRRFDEAIATLREAWAICRDSDDSYGVAHILHDLGSAYLDLARPAKAVDYLRQALVIRREIADRQGEARTLRRLGHVYRSLGQTSNARSCLRESLAVFEDLGDPRSETVAGELDGVREEPAD